MVCCSVSLIACSDNMPNDEVPAVSSLVGQNLYQQLIDQAREFASKSKVRTSSELGNQNVAAFVHAEESFEFWIFLAILHDQQGNYYALQQRFAKLAIEARSDAESEWAYSDVVALDYQFDHLADGYSTKHTLAQRAALGLSGTDAKISKIWVGAFEATDHSLSPCQSAIQLVSPQLSVKFGDVTADRLPCDATGPSQVERVSEFSILRGAAMPVAGLYQVDGQNTDLKGHGWVVRGWGAPPDSSNAAVVFDRTWLVLDENISLQAQRSRRASGRGPRITTGSLRALNATRRDKIELGVLAAELIDDENKRVGQLPATWQLISAKNAIKLTLSPIAEVEAVSSLTRPSWFGVVALEGSHTGYGFIDYSLR